MIEEKRKEIETRLGVKVIPFVLKKEGEEDAVGFLKELSLITELTLMDRNSAGQGFTAASDVLEAYLVKEDSDPRISQTNKAFWKGGVLQVLRMMEIAIPEIKKN